jgi:hypothetical protein
MQRHMAVILLLALCFPEGSFADSFWDDLLRFFGISASPAQMKGIESALNDGEIWIASLEDGDRKALTTKAGYRWPIFHPHGSSLLVLHGEDIIRITLTDPMTVETLFRNPNVEKLVGFDRQDPERVLVVMAGATPTLAVMDLRDGRVSRITLDTESDRGITMLAHIRGQDRTYDDIELFVGTESARRMSGVIEWTDVFIQRGDAKPVDVSCSDGTDCGQPSLSFNKKAVLYIKRHEE